MSKASNDAGRFGVIIQVEHAVEIANQLLDAHLATLPVVFGLKGSDGEWFDFGNLFLEPDTHEAILWNVKEIETTKTCEHKHIRLHEFFIEPITHNDFGDRIHHNDIINGKCEDCSKMFRGKWEPA